MQQSTESDGSDVQETALHSEQDSSLKYAITSFCSQGSANYHKWFFKAVH